MRRFAILFCAPIRLARATTPVNTSKLKESNDRVVCLDLTRPKAARYPAPMLPHALPATGKTEAHCHASTPNPFIAFASDSTTPFDEAALSDFADAAPADTPILETGHSHGVSAVGVCSLI